MNARDSQTYYIVHPPSARLISYISRPLGSINPSDFDTKFFFCKSCLPYMQNWTARMQRWWMRHGSWGSRGGQGVPCKMFMICWICTNRLARRWSRCRRCCKRMRILHISTNCCRHRCLVNLEVETLCSRWPTNSRAPKSECWSSHRNSVQDWSLQRPSNASRPFKHIYTSLKTTLQNARNPKLRNEDITWSPQFSLPATRTNKRMASSLQDVWR